MKESSDAPSGLLGEIDRRAGRSSLHFRALLTGILAGLVVVGYRYVLEAAEGLRTVLFGRISGSPPRIIFLFVFLVLAAMGIGWLVRRFPMIKGSGIPQVKGVLLRQFRFRWFKELCAKFLGGTIALGCGLSLGREGPSIQLGALVGAGVASRSGDSSIERRYLITAGASAGLSAAFNAPLAGMLFAIEELHKSISPLMLTCLLVSSMAAEIVSKYCFGLATIFEFKIIRYLPLRFYPHLIVLGIVCGLLGVLFNVSLLRSLDAHEKLLSRPLLRPVPAFLAAGLLGFFVPEVLGGGHGLIMAATSGRYGTFFLVALLAVKLAFTALSYGSGSPGGIFFPLLVIGALIGRLYADVLTLIVGLDPVYVVNFVILGMTAFFAAVVRAPLTGSLLVSEMAGSLSHFIALIVVSAIAHMVAELMKAKPIYDAFLDRLLSKGAVTDAVYEDDEGRAVLLIPVCIGSKAEHRTAGDLELPPGCVLVGVRRGSRNLFPYPREELVSGDLLEILTEEKNAAALKPVLMKLGSPE